jgi:hypothetical protein
MMAQPKHFVKNGERMVFLTVVTEQNKEISHTQYDAIIQYF